MWELLTGEEPYASMHYGAIIGLKLTLFLSIHVFLSNLFLSVVHRCTDNDDVMAIIECGFSSYILLHFCIALLFNMFLHL